MSRLEFNTSRCVDFKETSLVKRDPSRISGLLQMSGKTPTTPPRFLKLLPSTSVGRLVQRACVILRMSLGNMHIRALQTRDLSYDHYHMCTIHSGIGNKTGDIGS